MDFEALENSFKIINADQAISIVVQVLNTFSAVSNVLFCENVIHFFYFLIMKGQIIINEYKKEFFD